MRLAPHLNHRVHELFADAVEAPAAERLHWLDRHCRNVPAEVRSAVESLLDAHERAGTFLSDPTIARADTADAPARRIAGLMDLPKAIGPYQIERELGFGGFGTVYLATQERPIRRQVALKVINPGMDSRQVIKRFESERFALGLMDHPGIARVFDAGASETGQLYFVMELVDGRPIAEYFAANKLSIRERIELFVAVCQAVQHAHQKGVIHRDIKPTNVLVTEVDGKPVSKVIDFGVAKALVGRLGEHSLATEQRQMVGTPQYMSPEQAAGGAAAIDTRTDVYGLGATLYELLTGAPPLDPEQLRKASFAEFERIMLEQEPPLPSRRVFGRELQGNPGTQDTKSIARLLRGDLDRIVMRAIAKEPERRYATADALKEDLNRYLSGRPVEAMPATLRYRLAKYLRRNRRWLSVAAVVFLAVGAGAVMGLLGKLDAQRSAALAAAQAQLAEERQVAALLQSAMVRSAQQALVDLFRPRKGETQEEADAAVLRLDQLDAQFSAGKLDCPPQLAAPLHSGMAYAYECYHSYPKAAAHYREAIRQQRLCKPPIVPAMAEDLACLAVVLGNADRWQEADAPAVEAIGLFRSLPRGKERDEQLADTLFAQAVIRVMMHDKQGGVTRFHEGMAIIREGPGMTPEAEEEWNTSFAEALEMSGEESLAENYYGRAAKAGAARDAPSSRPSRDRPLYTEPDARAVFPKFAPRGFTARQ